MEFRDGRIYHCCRIEAASFISKRDGGPTVAICAFLLLVNEITMLAVRIVDLHTAAALTNALLIAMTLPVFWFSLSDDGGWPDRAA